MYITILKNRKYVLIYINNLSCINFVLKTRIIYISYFIKINEMLYFLWGDKYMKYIIKKACISCFSLVVSFLAISTVNSACTLIFSQPKEPETLDKYKKIR